MNLQKMEVWKITSFLKGVILGSSSRLVLGKTHTFESRTFVLFQVGFLLSNVSNHYCINPTMWEACMENIYIYIFSQDFPSILETNLFECVALSQWQWQMKV